MPSLMKTIERMKRAESTRCYGANLTGFIADANTSATPSLDLEACGLGSVADPKGGLSIFSVQKQPERPNGYSFLPSITPSSESSEPSLIKSIERPEPAFLLAKSASSVGSDAMIPESKGFGNLGQITVRTADDSYMQIKAAGESGSDIVVHDRKCLNHGIPKVRLINIQPANDPYLKMKTTGASGSDAAVPDHKSMNTGTPNVRVINVRPADDPFETKTIGESRFATQDFKSEGLAKPSDHDEPLQTKGNKGSGSDAQLPQSLQVLGSHGPPTAPTDQTIGPRSEDEDWLPATDGGDFAKRASKTQKEPSSRRFSKPTNPALNPDTTAPDEPQKRARKTQKEPSSRRFSKPTNPALNPDTTAPDEPQKRASKTQKEPSSRRFSKPTNPALNPDTTAPDEPQKAMDPKTKKKRLRKFLKRARKLKPKHKPAKADEE
eukprot:XP_011668851.1 PREDICTED: uncharacterized protein LOC105440435 [Strongylocentrotus purpuratus]